MNIEKRKKLFSTFTIRDLVNLRSISSSDFSYLSISIWEKILDNDENNGNNENNSNNLTPYSRLI